jgi:sialic acid synthase SpsE
MKLNSEIKIAGKHILDRVSPYIIGEVACSHQGDFSSALRLIDAVVDSGADCVQLQIFDPSSNMVPKSKLFKILEKLNFSSSQWVQIINYARKYEIDLSLFVYDEPSLELAIELKPDLLKLNSSELSNPIMLKAAAKSGIPFTLGTGSSTYQEIEKAVKIIIGCGQKNLILMHGIQNFPTTLENINISKIGALKRIFGGLIIFADHTDPNLEISTWIDLLALGQGANLLEKHIILKREKNYVDSEAALEPAEFTKYVAIMKTCYTALGQPNFDILTAADLKYRQFQKKSIVASESLIKGTKIDEKHVKFLRVQGDDEGIAPVDFKNLVRKKVLKKNLNEFDQILLKDLE